jgi:hypothetical protein
MIRTHAPDEHTPSGRWMTYPSNTGRQQERTAVTWVDDASCGFLPMHVGRMRFAEGPMRVDANSREAPVNPHAMSKRMSVMLSAASWTRLRWAILQIGPIPTWQIRWDQPHEGNLFEFLYRQRAFQLARQPVHTP